MFSGPMMQHRHSSASLTLHKFQHRQAQHTMRLGGPMAQWWAASVKSAALWRRALLQRAAALLRRAFLQRAAALLRRAFLEWAADLRRRPYLGQAGSQLVALKAQQRRLKNRLLRCQHWSVGNWKPTVNPTNSFMHWAKWHCTSRCSMPKLSMSWKFAFYRKNMRQKWNWWKFPWASSVRSSPCLRAIIVKVKVRTSFQIVCVQFLSSGRNYRRLNSNFLRQSWLRQFVLRTVVSVEAYRVSFGQLSIVNASMMTSTAKNSFVFFRIYVFKLKESIVTTMVSRHSYFPMHPSMFSKYAHNLVSKV